jgi:hypothetical protein
MPKKKKLIPLTKSPDYVKFTDQRDKALESVLWVHLKAIDQIFAKLHRKVVLLLGNRLTVQIFARDGAGMIRDEFELAASQVFALMLRLRSESYLLAHVSEIEAIARVFGHTLHYDMRKAHKTFADKTPMHDGAHLADRVQLWLDRLRRKLEDALSLSLVQGSTDEEIKARVNRVFGGARGKRPGVARALNRSKFKEADPPYEDPGSTIKSISVGFANDEDWEGIIDDYFDENLPASIFRRGPTDKTLFYDALSGETEERYAYEVENEITDDFVRSIRAGTQDAATENGITDFEWVAILDKVTDDCCRTRDGLSSEEIEKAIDDGKLDTDDCDAIVPPAHFNCRCRSTPMTADMPERPNVDYASFGEWLEGKGKS